jgi:predicted nuclease of predicted toxin-antitoxin system
MKFWVDENIASYVVSKLKQHGHEIYKAKRGTDDISILEYAIKEDAVIITCDQDFERLVLKERKPCNGIIWIHFSKYSILEELTAKLLRTIKVHENKLTTSFITLSLGDANIRRLKL